MITSNQGTGGHLYWYLLPLHFAVYAGSHGWQASDIA